MTREQLEHAIRAACDVSGDTEVYVFGSQAILGEHPDAPEALRMSLEADVAPKNYPGLVDQIDGALGELSPFHATHGFYVHGVPIESAILPDGWQARTVRLSNGRTSGYVGWCIEGHDLAASKLAAFRDKDRAFVRVLLQEHMIGVATLVGRVLSLPPDRVNARRLVAWVNATVGELGQRR